MIGNDNDSLLIMLARGIKEYSPYVDHAPQIVLFLKGCQRNVDVTMIFVKWRV